MGYTGNDGFERTPTNYKHWFSSTNAVVGTTLNLSGDVYGVNGIFNNNLRLDCAVSDFEFTPSIAGIQMGRSGTNIGIQLATTNNSNLSYIDFTYAGADYTGIMLYNNSSDTMAFHTGAASRCTINCSGVTALAFISTSDISLKTNIEDATVSDCYQLLDNVNAKTYKRIDNPDVSEVAFIAQDIQANAPSKFQNLVVSIHDENDNVTLAFDSPKITTVLWNIIKDLKARIEVLEANAAGV